MKKIRLLTSLVGITGLSMGLVPAIASCSCSNGLQIEFISKLQERKFNEDTNGLAFAFHIPDIDQVENIKAKIVNLLVDGSEAQSVSGLITTVYDSAGHIKVTINTDTLLTQWENAQKFSFDLQFTNKTNGKTAIISGFDLIRTEGGESEEAEKTFQNCDWSYLGGLVDAYRQGSINEQMFCESMNSDLGTAYSSFNDFIGETKYVNIYGVKHVVRIIGVNHDTISTGETYAGTKALFTFELVTLLSNSNGYLTVKWGDNNCKYPESNLCQTLNDSSNKEYDWYNNGSTTVKATSPYYQLMQSIGSEAPIKKVNKTVAISNDSGASYTSTTYDCYLFPLTLTEIGGSPEITQGSVYTYWQDSPSKIKNDYKDIARPYWLCSPDDIIGEEWSGTQFVYAVKETGRINMSDITWYVSNYCVSFAFCI